MKLSVIIAALGCTVISSAEARNLRCELPLVPTEKVARGVAEAVISGRMSSERMAEYVLNVEQDEHDPDKWAVWQGVPPNPDGTITGGGGGMQMRIDKCSGKISNAHYQR